MAYMDFSMEALYGIEGRTIVVNGGTGLIGRELAAHLLTFGAKVAVIDGDADAVKKTVDELSAGAPGEKVAGYVCDITKPAQVERTFARIDRDLGGVYGLVNAQEARYESFLSQADTSEWDRLMDYNVKGTMLCTKAAGEIMARETRGRVINLSSLCSTHGRPRLSFYAATKAAIDAFTFTMAAEWMYRGITVNAIAPDYKYFASSDCSAEKEKEARESIMGVACTPDRFKDLVVFLLSDISAYISGETIGADGGATHGDIKAYKPENWPVEE